jgi:hypothetical protein
MTRLRRIAMVKVLKSSLTIVRTINYFYSIQHVRKIIRTDSFVTVTLSAPSYN